MDLAYSIDQQTYVHLVRLFLDNRLSDFLPSALESWNSFKEPYYRSSINTLIQDSLKSVTLDDLDDIIPHLVHLILIPKCEYGSQVKQVEDRVNSILREEKQERELLEKLR